MKYSRNSFSPTTPVNKNKWVSNYFVVSKYSLNNAQFGHIFLEERERNIHYLLKCAQTEKLRLNIKMKLISEPQLAGTAVEGVAGRAVGRRWDWQLKPQISD